MTDGAGSADLAARGAEFSRTEFFTVLGALFAVLPVLFCAMRVLVVSEGDLNTLKMLVQNLDLKTLVLATILPVGGMLVVAFQTALWVFAWPLVVTPPGYRRFAKAAFWCLLPGTAAVVWVGMNWAERAFSLGLAVLVIVTILVHRVMAEGTLRWSLVFGGSALFVISVVAVASYVLSENDLWVPFERIQVKDRSSVEGYVLSSDGEWTRFMDADDRSIHVVKTADVESREFVVR